MIGRAFTGHASVKNTSPARSPSPARRTCRPSIGVGWFLHFLAMLSLSLGILNLLPIPILDGGHLLYYLIELVKGSPVSERAMAAGQYVGPGAAGRPDGPGVLQRHPEQPGALMPDPCVRRLASASTRRPDPGLNDPQPDVLMTPTPPRRLLALALIAAMGSTALPALAQSADPFALAGTPQTSASIGTFTVSDIRIDGLQRISAGTVFTYLPIERGDTRRRLARRRGDPRALQDRLLRGRATSTARATSSSSPSSSVRRSTSSP